MILNKIHHIAIIVSNYQKAIDFYTHILHCRIIRDIERPDKNDRKIDLELMDGTQLELFVKKDCPQRLSYPEALGLRHLAFVVDDIQHAFDYLKQQAIQVEPIRMDPYTKKATLFFYDPDGLPIELVEK